MDTLRTVLALLFAGSLIAVSFLLMFVLALAPWWSAILPLSILGIWVWYASSRKDNQDRNDFGV